jgi:ABC-type lipoprotein release transport system permease subunit
VTGLQDQITRRARPTLWILLGTAAFVLIIACANVANLTLTRVVGRERELAVHAALGATRGMLRRALLIESLLLSGAGALLGVGVAKLGLGGLVAFTERFTSRATEVTLDGRVLLFAMGIATLAAVVFALIPNVPASAGTGTALPQGGRTTGGVGRKRVQRGLVVAQVAVSFVLLVGAGLLGRTFLAMQSVDPGFETDDVLTMEIPSANPTARDEQRPRYETLLEQVRALPGVTSAALSSVVPLRDRSSFFGRIEMSLEGQVVPAGQPTPRADFRSVSPDYFRTLGVQLLAGRSFEPSDHYQSEGVVVVNQSFADRYFPDEDPIGKRMAWTDRNLSLFMGVSGDWRRIVGVVGDSKEFGLASDVSDVVFHPYSQEPFAWSLLIRGPRAEGFESPVRDIIRTMDTRQPIEDVFTLERIRSESLAPQRLNAALIGGFALLAMVIAAVGVFSVLAFSVSQRAREFGIRTALGARRSDVEGTVLWEGLVLTGSGLLLGGLAAAGLSRVLTSFLFEVSTVDPATFVLVALVLTMVAATASWLPAARDVQYLALVDSAASNPVGPLQDIDRGVVSAGNRPQRIAGPDGVRRRPGGRIGRQALHVGRIRLREQGHMVVGRVPLPRRLQNPRTFQRREHTFQPRPAGATAAVPEVDGHPGRMDGPRRRIAGLTGGGPRQARHDQLLTAPGPVLGGETLNEERHFRPSVGKRNLVHCEVPIRAHPNEPAIGRKDPDTRGSVDECVVVLTGHAVLPVERRGGTPQALPPRRNGPDDRQHHRREETSLHRTP